MDDADLLRRALGEPGTDPAARERARARLRAEIEATTSGTSRRAGKQLILVGIAAIAITVALVAAIVPATRESATARELRGLGELASAQPTVAPHLGQVLVWTAETHHLEGFTDVANGIAYELTIRSSLERRTDAQGGILEKETIRSVEFASKGDRAAWEQAGSPELPTSGDVRREQFPPGDAGWFDLDAISTDPDVLLEGLRDGEVAPLSPGEDEVFLLIGQLLGEPSLTLEQREALFEVAASLEGVEALGDVTDPLGRFGRGFALETADRRAVIIFDPADAMPLATELFDLRSGTPQLFTWAAFEGAELV